MNRNKSLRVQLFPLSFSIRKTISKKTINIAIYATEQAKFNYLHWFQITSRLNLWKLIK